MVPSARAVLTALSALGAGAALGAASLANAAPAAPASAFVPKAEVKWADAGIPGVKIAPVKGDINTGAGHFFLQYPPGFVSPAHHHTPDHFAVTVSGNLVLVTGGTNHALPPGSFFSFTNGASHVARCEGSEPCVMFIDTRGKWDVVPE